MRGHVESCGSNAGSEYDVAACSCHCRMADSATEALVFGGCPDAVPTLSLHGHTWRTMAFGTSSIFLPFGGLEKFVWGVFAIKAEAD